MKKKKFLALFIAVLFVLVGSVNAFGATAKSTSNNTKTLMPDFSSSEYQIKSLPNGKKQIVVKNSEAFLKSQNINIPANAKDVSVVIDISEPTKSATNSVVQPMLGGYYTAIPDFWQWEAYTGGGIIPGSYGTGVGPRTLIGSVAKGYTHSFTANVGISAGEVTAGVGFTIGESFTVTSGSNYSVPAGYTGVQYAYPYTEYVEFDVYNIFGTHVGYGAARQYLGAVWISYLV